MPFEYEFVGCKKLQLQDLTAQGIRLYVQDKLNNHRHFAGLACDKPVQASALIDNIVRMSSGVFLWVDIVVRSLLEGLTNSDTVRDLQRRLQTLPPELDSLYSTMLRGINPPFYKEQASRLLQIFYQLNGMVSSLALSFADEPDPQLAISADLGPDSLQQVDARIDMTTNRLKSRCRGLLEVQKYYGSNKPDIVDHPQRPDKVQYLHLTVKEFLEKPEVWSELLSWAPQRAFDSNVACLSGLILRLKKTFVFHGWGRHVAGLLDSAMSFARQAEDSTAQAQTALVEEVDRIACLMFPPERQSHWSTDPMGRHHEMCSVRCVADHRPFSPTPLQKA